MHAWGETALRPAQRRALDAIERQLAAGRVLRPICLVGDFGAGKTTLARYWLAQHFDDPEPYYCPLNRPLLDALKEEGTLEHLADIPAKARLILQIALMGILERRFRDADALVFDAIEVLMPYRISLPTLLLPYTRAGKVALVCVPESADPPFSFALRPSECERVDLTTEEMG